MDLFPTPPSKNERLIRTLDLILVLVVAFSGTLFYNIYHLFFGAIDVASGAKNFQTIFSTFNEIVAIALVFYILFRQNRKPIDIGFSFKWKDLLHVPVIVFWSYLAFYLTYYVIHYGHYYLFGQIVPQKAFDFKAQYDLNFWFVIYFLLSPFYEEFIVRAFTITELKFLTKRSSIAILVSVLIQTTYHLYQGWTMALSMAGNFLVFSIYFVRYKRILPVIIAHLIMNLISIMYYFTNQ